jgi:predicted enzyme related to lactoylglutathione lyase
MEFSICIDVDDVDRAVEFYGRGLGLTVVDHEPDWAQVKLGAQTFWIMKVPAGVQGQISRDYRRHWTPVHLDFAVDDIEAAVKRAVDAGGKLEGEIQRNAKGALANMVDPSGNGVDLFCSAKK